MSRTAGPAQPTDAIARRDSQQLRRGHLGTVAIAFFVISAAAPLTGMAGGAPFAMLLGDGAGVPFAYLLVTLLMLVFAVGYVAMARHHTSAGAFYAFVARAMGGHAGGAAAWMALLGYNAMQIGLYGLWGVASAGFVSTAAGLTIPWWVMSYLAMALIALCGYRRIDLSLKVLGVLVGAEFLIVLLFDVMVLVKGGHGGGGALDASSFTLGALGSGAPAIGLLFSAASFVGFEATTIYSEEAKDPRRTVPRATYLAVLTIGLFFVLTSWLMVNAYGDDATLQQFIGSEELGDPTNFLFAVATPYLGDFLVNYVMSFLFASSVFAALLAFHNAVARYAFALGREGLVPDTLGRTHAVHLSPHMGSVGQSVLAFVVVSIFVLLGLDPAATLFTWLTQLGTLAISYLMALAALAVLIFFTRTKGLERNMLSTRVAPAIAATGLLAVAAYATSQFGFLIGDPSSPLAWMLPALIVVAAAAGVISAAVLRRREPAAFEVMGRDRPEETVAGGQHRGT